jgi:hypothetical protein
VMARSIRCSISSAHASSITRRSLPNTRYCLACWAASSCRLPVPAFRSVAVRHRQRSAPIKPPSCQFSQPVDQQSVDVELSQVAGQNAWQIVPTGQTPARNSVILGLNGGGDSSYVRVQVAQGVDVPAVFFGIQIAGSRAVPPLTAGWTSPVTLVHSFYNAINRQEYQRAYSYWETPGRPNGVTADFGEFVRGYATTTSVAVTTGAVMSDAGAGNIFYAVPVALSAEQAGGSTRKFYGCYLLHQVNVNIGNTAPPYPIALRSARIFAAPANAGTATLLDQATAFVQAGQCTQ